MVTVLATSCTASEIPPEAEPTGSAEVQTPTASAPPPVPAATSSSSVCRPGPGRRVTELRDVVVPAVEVAPVVVSGEVVVDGFAVPAQLVDAGCVIRYDAPGGCLGAVEVSGATIPAATIPASVIRGGRLGDGRVVDDTVIEEVSVPGASVPGDRAGRVCQVEREGELLTVSRPGIVRTGFSRDGLARPGTSRARICDAEDCLPAVQVDAVRLEPVRLPDVDVDPGRLESRELREDRDVNVVTGEGETSYVAPARVLFDTDRAVIREDAEAALEDIAVAIKKRTPDARLLVEGHTDDRGDEAYGLALSRRRAANVADWLAAEAGFRRERIRARGLGEAAPVVPNTSDANRQRNRRVVITVLDPPR